MDNFIIAIPSKGRVMGSTFAYLKNALRNSDIPVHVYVDQSEFAAYVEYHPEFEIIPHSKSSIGAIRRLIQDDAAEDGNVVFMLDDDITGFYDYTGSSSVPFSEIIDSLKILFNSYNYDLVGLHIKSNADFRMSQPPGAFFGVAYAFSPRLHELGIRFTEEQYISEDMDFSIQVALHDDEIEKTHLERRVSADVGGADSHFGHASYTAFSIGLYRKYGNVVMLLQHMDDLGCSIDMERLDYFKTHGVVYSKGGNNALVNLYQNKFIEGGFILEAMETCHCKKTPEGEFTYDWDYFGYDGSIGDHEALRRGHNCPYDYPAAEEA